MAKKKCRARPGITATARPASILLVAFLVALVAGACDSTESDPGPEAPDPDDVEILLEQTTSASRDRIKATITSASDQVLESVVVTLFFIDDQNVQLGQMPIPFIGTFRRGDSAERELGLPSSILRHDRYECFRYRVDVTNEEGVTGNKEYGGSCG